jgi:hypothetical protein
MALADDDARIGDVWRGLENGKPPETTSSSFQTYTYYGQFLK